MLNNLSIQKKLALVALGPVVVLLLLSGLRVRGDLSDASDATDTQARSTLSALTGQLFEAVRSESVENQNAVAIRGLDLDEVRDVTDAAIDRWVDAVGEFGSIDDGSLLSLVTDFNAHRANVAAEFGTTDGAEAVFEADAAVLRTISAYDGLLSSGADVSAVDLREASDLTTVSNAAAELQLLGMWAANTSVVPELLPAAIGAAQNASDSFGLRNGTELPIGEGSYETIVEELRGLAPGNAVGVSVNDWQAASDTRAAQLSTVRTEEVAAASTAALAAQSDAQGAMRTAGLMTLVGLIAAIAAVLLVSKVFITALGALRDEASRLAEHDLAQLAGSPSSGPPAAEVDIDRAIDALGDDEFGEVAAGLLAIRESAVGVGDHIASLQSGIADTYVNLARRNQSLVDRQLEAIDTLEAQERDSDRLALMYRVDHLATRMRRNAESLLVIADAKVAERHSPAVQLREVVRVAIGEVEDYRRIIPIALDDLHVAGHRGQDLAHLLAELMENAAQHSPPGTAVDVSGGFESSTGNYLITILDHGTGVDPEQLVDINTLLSTPPASTLMISHSIGLHVVSRLAHSLGLDVALDHGEEGGLIASVKIPANVIAEWAHTVSAAPTSAPMTTRPEPAEQILVAEAFQASSPSIPDISIPAAAAEMPELVEPEHPAVPLIDMPGPELPSSGVEEQAEVPSTGEPEPQLDVFGDVVPDGPPHDLEPEGDAAALFTSIDTPEVADTQDAFAAVSVDELGSLANPESPAEAFSQEPLQSVTASPVPEAFAPSASVTTAGLVKRQRQSTESLPEVDLETDRTAPSQRTPDQVRNMLSRYKVGLERGRGATGTDGE